MAKSSAFAPGRVEILGNHTDYNRGYVLAAAIDLGTTATGSRLEEPLIRLSSSEMTTGVDVRFSNDTALQPLVGDAAWANYPLGVFEQFRAAGVPMGGVEVHFESTLPLGAGLSSSAALTVSFATLLVDLFGAGPAGIELAKLCRRGDNEFVGVNCGLLDQATSVLGQRDGLVFLDCGEETAERIALPPGLELLVADTGVAHRLAGGEYNDRYESCMTAAAALGVGSLREADMEMLDAAQMDPVVAARARHIIGENNRVLSGRRMLAAGEAEGFGGLMTASHRSSQENFDNSTPELDLLVEIAASEPGVLGARLSGGGFGGAVVALVNTDDAQRLAADIAAGYERRSGRAGACFVAKIGAGACLRAVSQNS